MKPIVAVGTTVAVIGVPAAGYGVWTFSSGKSSSDKSIGNVPGYTKSRPTADMGADRLSDLSSFLGNPEDVDFQFKTGGCFSNFFPQVSIDLPAHATASFTPDDWSVVSGTPADDSADVNKAVGCAALQLKKSATEDDYYAFKTEITAKVGNVGLSIYTGMAFKNDLKGYLMKEYINFLEKKGDKWEVVGGLYYKHSASCDAISVAKAENFKPGGESDWFTNLKDREYLGFWMEDNSASNDQEVLKDVRLKLPQSTGNSLANNLLEGHWRWSDRGNALSGIYKKDQWLKMTHSNKNNVKKESVKTAFETFYKPFKDRKGVWKKQSDLDPECFKLYSKKDLKESDEDFKKYSDFCYAKQT